MVYLAAAVLCSVLVSILLKLMARRDVDVAQAIGWNYATAAALAGATWLPAGHGPRTAALPWPTLLALGATLPALFLVLAASVRWAGIVRTEVAQRLSLVPSLLAAFVLFGEPVGPGRLAGAVLGLAALGALLWNGTTADGDAPRRPGYPLLVFVGFAAVDVLFKHLAQTGTPLGEGLAVVFVLALGLMACWLGFGWLRGTGRPQGRAVPAGLALGLLNFGNILCYLRAHQALPGQPALVFAGMNLGVVGLGALAGVWLFGERLGRINRVGLVLAAVAIGILARAFLP